jgi:hypothetical protein
MSINFSDNFLNIYCTRKGNNHFININSNGKVSNLNIGFNNVKLLTGIETNPYTKKPTIKLILNSEQISFFNKLENAIIEKVNIPENEFKSSLKNNQLTAKILERYERFELDIKNSDDEFLTSNSLSCGMDININLHIKNVWTLKQKGKVMHGFIIYVRDILVNV